MFEIGAALALIGKPGGEVSVAGAEDASVDEIIPILDCALDAGALGAERLQMGLSLTNGRRTIVQEIGEKRLQAFGAEQAIRHGVDHDGLQRLIAHADARTDRLAAA
ncbi:MAG: hypothetical protein H2054_09085 [Sphingomonas sp.]|uniref:hypothetical protein n=1 Tax=Sphingomonas sp. TaxID=28214 RepID=UPI0017CAA485|nr:hypothetical protein [Erythrobacter sp.]MBA4773247.1 hypothetical protein [Sphingomonas sp.]